MSNSEPTVREKIILAAIDCIEKEGVHSLTTRSIAKAAGVNVAAINYYFGSKDKLVSEALQYTLNNFGTDIQEFLSQTGLNPQSLLQLVFNYYLEGGFRYPGITKAHLYNPMIHDDYQGDFAKLFNSLLNQLYEKLTNAGFQGNSRELKFAIVQIISAVSLPVVLPGLFREFLDGDLKKPEIQREYVEYLISRFFPN